MTVAQEKRIAELMKTLDCSREEAIDVLKEDETIDKGGRTYFDLDPEAEKRAKKFANVDTHKRPIKTAPRERKPNEAKRYLIDAIEEMLQYSDVQAEDITVTNPERQLDFTYKGIHYRVILSAPRK